MPPSGGDRTVSRRDRESVLPRLAVFPGCTRKRVCVACPSRHLQNSYSTSHPFPPNRQCSWQQAREIVSVAAAARTIAPRRRMPIASRAGPPTSANGAPAARPTSSAYRRCRGRRPSSWRCRACACAAPRRGPTSCATISSEASPGHLRRRPAPCARAPYPCVEIVPGRWQHKARRPSFRTSKLWTANAGHRAGRHSRPSGKILENP